MGKTAHFWQHFYLHIRLSLYGLPLLTPVTIIHKILFKAAQEALGAETQFGKGLYISNPCSKGLANHKRLGQLNNESRVGFSERQTLKRHELQQCVFQAKVEICAAEMCSMIQIICLNHVNVF